MQIVILHTYWHDVHLLAQKFAELREKHFSEHAVHVRLNTRADLPLATLEELEPEEF